MNILKPERDKSQYLDIIGNKMLSVSTPLPDNSIEHERTPGAVAVMPADGRIPAEVVDSAASAGAAKTNFNFSPSPLVASSSPSLPLLPDVQKSNAGYVQHWTCNREYNGLTRVVGFGKLRNLLQPKHPYFVDKGASIKYWHRYYDKKLDCDLVYPRVKTYHRENPFRRYQLNRQCSARSVKAFIKFTINYKLHGMRVVDIEKTMPVSVSRFLSARGKSGIDMVWNMNKRFWDEMVSNSLVGGGHARRSNLHTWQTEKPLEPHYHFHELLPNYEVVGAKYQVEDMPQYPCSKCGGTKWVREGEVSWFCATCYPPESIPVFEKREWRRQAGGTMVPWSDKELILLKAIWLNIQINFVRRYCISDAWACQAKLLRFQRKHGLPGLIRLVSFLSQFNKGLIDIYVSFTKCNSEEGKAKLMHKLNYNGRHVMEDYAVYSNQHPDCPAPPAFIQHYDNKARLFGWWRDIRKLVSLLPKDEKQKLSPYNAEPMDYLGRWSTIELLDMHDGNVVAVDFIRGRPLERLLNNDDREWLENVDFQSWLFALGP